MKNFINLVLCLSFSFGLSQIVNIPDTNFKNVLLSANITNSIALSCPVADSNYYKIDSNSNGEIEESEALEVCYLNLSYSNITNLTGIEKFINLQYLFCNNNNLTTINSVSELVQLERLFCSTNYITSLNLINLINLRILNCWNNQINTLDFSNNPLLVQVYCRNNQLTSLDFSNNPLFNDLGCKNNPNLTSINIKNGTSQLFGPQTQYNECWIGLPNLTSICADEFEKLTLQNFLENCGNDTSSITITSNCALSVEEYNNNSINVYPNPSDGKFTIYFNDTIKEANIEIYTMLGQKIDSIIINNTRQYEYENSRLASGTYLIKVSCNEESISKRVIIK